MSLKSLKSFFYFFFFFLLSWMRTKLYAVNSNLRFQFAPLSPHLTFSFFILHIGSAFSFCLSV
ncbi:hypothetical protein BC829DRAFT_388573, partial [Chytridium lagenaria]